ncbi:MAG: C1 family peptidase [Planctomycetes bacterium]|jgi:hypothetical protein|nr:C1 family peptidase [Planctomycetota bacterium]
MRFWGWVALVLALASGGTAFAADRPPRTLVFEPGTAIDRVEIDGLDDPSGTGKKFQGTGRVVLLDASTADVVVLEKRNVAKGLSTYTVRTLPKALPKLSIKFTAYGEPPVVTKAQTMFVSVTGAKTKLKGPDHFEIGPGEAEFRLGFTAVTRDATDDVPFRLALGADGLPASVSWADSLPPIGDQGRQGSCVGWASAYNVKTSWEKRSNPGWNLGVTSGRFSPAFVYNQINGGQDNGSDPSEAMQLMVDKGAATLADMPYSDLDFQTQPSPAALASAANYKNVDYRYYGATFSLSAMKQYLANTGPLVFGIEVDSSFMNGSGDYTQWVGPNQGGHAIAIVGYDDNHGGGAFRVANSWGPNWRDSGFVWVTYPAMQSIFLGAWSMVDGPNGGGGGGGEPGAPTGFDASDGVSTAYVALSWNLLPEAAGFQLERQATSGAWQVIATPQADVFHHQDFAVEPDTTYQYRLAGVGTGGALGPYATTTGSTAAGGGGETVTLTASNPSGGGTAYPDRIALSFTTLAGNPWYVVLRSDGEEGFRNGQYIVLEFLQGTSSFNDYVAPGSRYAYSIAVFDSATFAFLGLSNVAYGATSGTAGGALDVGIVYLDEPTVVTRGYTSSLGIELFNYGAACDYQAVFVGMAYYFGDGTTGILEYADIYDTVPIYWVLHSDAAMDTYDYSYLVTSPLTPVYIYPWGTADVGFWWYVEVYPADSGGTLLDDADWNDNSMYGNQMLYVQ